VRHVRADVQVKEETVLAAPGRDVAVTAAVLALTAVVFALAADHGVLARIQHVDDAWLRLMVSGRSAPVTAIAKFFNLLGLVYVTLPVRIAIAGFLALRRRWWHLAAFVSAVVLSEVLIAEGDLRPGPAAAGFSVLMALSRAYLGAHWLSDAVAGVLLGASCALLAAVVVNWLQRRRSADRPGAHRPVPGTVRPADRR
jgi:membrane-associated phospholipid phosphatase